MLQKQPQQREVDLEETNKLTEPFQIISLCKLVLLPTVLIVFNRFGVHGIWGTTNKDFAKINMEADTLSEKN